MKKLSKKESLKLINKLLDLKSSKKISLVDFRNNLRLIPTKYILKFV